MEGGLCDFVWYSQCKLYIEHFWTWVNTESEKRTWSIWAGRHQPDMFAEWAHFMVNLEKDLQRLKICCDKNIWLVTNIFNNACICLNRTIIIIFFPPKWSISYLAINLATFLYSFFLSFLALLSFFFPSSKTHMLAHTCTDRQGHFQFQVNYTSVPLAEPQVLDMWFMCVLVCVCVCAFVMSVGKLEPRAN